MSFLSSGPGVPLVVGVSVVTGGVSVIVPIPGRTVGVFVVVGVKIVWVARDGVTTSVMVSGVIKAVALADGISTEPVDEP